MKSAAEPVLEQQVGKPVAHDGNILRLLLELTNALMRRRHVPKLFRGMSAALGCVIQQ